MAGWALIIEPDEGRAAQYGYLVEQRKLVPTTARGAADAVFHVKRLGPPQLIIAEANLPSDDGLALLRGLRALAPAAGSPAVLIVESRQPDAARQMIELGIIAILPRKHSMTSMLTAIDRALGRQTEGGAESAESQNLESPSALEVAEKLAQDPLVDVLARLPVIEGPLGDESLQKLAETTAKAFGTSIAALWIDRWDSSGRSWFKLHRAPKIPAVGTPAHWTALRSVAGTQPLHVSEVARHRVLARNPISTEGALGSFAAAPFIGADGFALGAVAIVEPVGGKVDAALLEPLIFWSQRIVTELELRRSLARPAELAARFQSSAVPTRVAMDAAIASLGVAVLVTDANGVVCFANRAIAPILGLGSLRVIGLRRADAVSVLRGGAGADEEAVRTITEAPPGAAAQLVFEVRRPERRVLRWRCEAVQLGAKTGRLDEFHDITQQTQQSEALVRIDALTGLTDRRGGLEALGREVGRALRLGDQFAVALFEVDGLARLEPMLVEPTFRAVAWVLRDTLRAYDLLSRRADDQLLACLPSTPRDRALAFGVRACRVVERTQVAGVPRITVSGGVAQFDPAHPVEEMLAEAARKLADAKGAGGNRVV
jgi:diguanylate cyclase (GGDEF)-like protein